MTAVSGWRNILALRRLAACATALLLTLTTHATAAPDEPAGYRMGKYRAEVPATLKGASVIDPAGAIALWDSKGAIFVDVLPRPPRPAGLAEGTVWRPPVRRNIPGSTWLANVGFGKINGEVEAYFRTNLEKLSGGNRAAPLLFYCLANCWMSWNAAKRALEWGYTAVYWFPEGTNGWTAAGRDVVESEPVPLKP